MSHIPSQIMSKLFNQRSYHEDVMPESLFRAQVAWRCLVRKRLSELEVLERIARAELSEFAHSTGES